jgi:hypothetical protein
MLTIPREVPEMDLFDYTSLCLVKEMAGGMTKVEILDTFHLDEKDLSKDEEIYFDEFYAYGKGMAVHTVIQNLIESTRGRQGQAAAMQFLRRFAKQFENEIEGDASGAFSFSFGKES